MLVRQIACIAALTLVGVPCDVKAQDSTSRAGHYLFGAGVNLALGQDVSPAFEIGREWRDPSSRIGFRLTADYSTLNESRHLTDFLTGERVGEYSLRSRDLTLGGAATFALARGRIQPYVISGFMLRRHLGTGSVTAADGSTPPPGDPRYPQSYELDGTSVGLQGGLGLSAQLGATTLFCEARTFRAVTGLGDQRNRASLVTLGVRF